MSAHSTSSHPDEDAMELEPGTHWWCGCGKSAHLPLCDGSHKGTRQGPVKVVLKQPTRVTPETPAPEMES